MQHPTLMQITTSLNNLPHNVQTLPLLQTLLKLKILIKRTPITILRNNHHFPFKFLRIEFEYIPVAQFPNNSNLIINQFLSFRLSIILFINNFEA